MSYLLVVLLAQISSILLVPVFWHDIKSTQFYKLVKKDFWVVPCIYLGHVMFAICVSCLSFILFIICFCPSVHAPNIVLFSACSLNKLFQIFYKILIKEYILIWRIVHFVKFTFTMTFEFHQFWVCVWDVITSNFLTIIDTWLHCKQGDSIIMILLYADFSYDFDCSVSYNCIILASKMLLIYLVSKILLIYLSFKNCPKCSH